MRPIPSVPSFALAGQPNEGKTTVMATLAEDDKAAISPVPGTTQTCQRYPVSVDGTEILVFFDTPGFENSGAVLDWFEKNRALPDPLGAFIATFKGTGKFRQETEILTPLAGGAAIMYVADASRPVRPVDQQEVEILRLTGARRIGVINSKEGQGQYLDDWKQLMARDFNHVHEFNGHKAAFRDRIKLLESARSVIQEWGAPMGRSIQALLDDWEARLRNVAGLMVQDIRALAELRERETIQNPGDEERASGQARDRLKKTIQERENTFRKKVRAIFRHSDERWLISELLEQDLFSEEVWRLLGLTRNQLLVSGALLGGLIGFWVHPHIPVFALPGAVIGAAVAWQAVKAAIHVQLPGLKWGPLSFGGGRMGGRQAEASISPQSNLFWVVLDRYLLYVELCASWAHGRREKSAGPIGDEEKKMGFTTKWKSDDRKKVSEFIANVLKRRNQEKSDNAERSLRELLLTELRNITA